MQPKAVRHAKDTRNDDPSQTQSLQGQLRFLEGFKENVPATSSSSFITCKLKSPLVDTLFSRLSVQGLNSLHYSEHKPAGRQKIEQIMQTRGVWNKSRANPKNKVALDNGKDEIPVKLPTPKPNPPTSITTSNRKGILKPSPVSPASPNFPISQRHRQRRLRNAKLKKVSLDADSPSIHHYSDESNDPEQQHDLITRTLKRIELDDWETEEDEDNEMSQGQRPSLKLKLSTNNINVQTPSNNEAQTPNPQSAVRTPSIKLNFGKKPSISTCSTPATKKEQLPNSAPSTGKKRKRTKINEGSEDELAKPTPPQRRLTLKTTAASTKTPVTPGPVFRLKTKGKVPKRPLGVGYDSELEDREIDPVILEGFILRMLPGPDCDYIQTAIRDGTIGVHRAQGGADIRMRFLDTNGRRGILIVNGHQYATSVVDLPCIIEGMKSWDKKGWIKSMDISQMMLVLGPCASDDEAKNYPLPSDVDPKTFAYAHGITAPMKWVRKRRFARTRRARVDDIESIERKVNALLEADAKALSSTFQVFDHDPRVEQDQYSEVEDDYDDEQDAEGEDDIGYFPRQDSVMVQTPVEMDTHVDQDQIDELEAMFNEDDDEGAAPNTNGHLAPKAANSGLHPPDVNDSSVAVTSASASPSASVANTAALTPAGDGNQATSDDDDDDEDDASDKSDSEKDADDNLQQVKDRIADMESKIREQTEMLRRTTNAILKKKLAKKIGELRDDVRMMKVQNGLAAEGDGDDGDE